jgi:hypothetical protein
MERQTSGQHSAAAWQGLSTSPCAGFGRLRPGRNLPSGFKQRPYRPALLAAQGDVNPAALTDTTRRDKVKILSVK